MKPERIWIAIVCLLLLSGFAIWIGSDESLPAASVWLWLAAFGIAFLPAVIALVMIISSSLGSFFTRKRQRAHTPPESK